MSLCGVKAYYTKFLVFGKNTHMYIYIYLFIFVFLAHGTHDIPTPTYSYLPTYSYRVWGGKGWPGGCLADSSGARVFCIVPLTRLVPHRGQLYLLPLTTRGPLGHKGANRCRSLGRSKGFLTDTGEGPCSNAGPTLCLATMRGG
jgi:hypothetical protein